MIEPQSVVNPVALAREIADRVIRPHAADVDAQARHPKEAFEALGSAGLLGLMVQRVYGGLEGNFRSFVGVAEEIARGCASTAMLYVMHHTQYLMLVDHGTEQQQKTFLPDVARGKSFFASGTTEPQVGGNADVCVSAKRREGEEILITATKPVVSGALDADWVCVTTRATPDAPGNRCSMVIVPGPKQGRPGVKPFGSWDCIGMRGTGSIGVEFTDCRVPAWHQVGPEDCSYMRLTSMAIVAYIGFASVWVGIAQAALDETLNHLLKRKHEFSRGAPGEQKPAVVVNTKLAEYETVQRQVAEMRTKVEAARATVLAGAMRIDEFRTGPATPIDPEQMAQIHDRLLAARLVAGETVVDVCRIAMRVCGVAGLRRGHPLERHMRDGLTAQVMAPGEDVSKLIFGKKTLGLLPIGRPA